MKKSDTEIINKIVKKSKNDPYHYFYDELKMDVSSLLQLFSSKENLEKLDKKALLEFFRYLTFKDINEVLLFALDHDDFYNMYFREVEYFTSLMFNIHYDIILKYLKKDLNIVKKYFSIYKNDYIKLFNNDELSNEELKMLVLKCQEKRIVEDFCYHHKRRFNFFNSLNNKELLSLILNGVKFSQDVISLDKVFESLKNNSLIETRKNIYYYERSSQNTLIEKKLESYYDELLSHYNDKSGLFKEYDEIVSKIKKKGYVNFDDSENNYIINNSVYTMIMDNYPDDYEKELKSLTSKKISEIVVDYLFKDNIYNVFLNIKEMLRYDKVVNKLDKDVKKFYETILNIDSISNIDKIRIFNCFKDKKIDYLYYEDIRSLKNLSYDMINSSLYQLDEKKDNKLSQEYNVPIYDLRNREFYILTRCLHQPFMKNTSNKRDCYSLISNNNTNVFHGDYVYGYSNFDINKVLHIFENDAFSSYNDDLDASFFVNRIMTPLELTSLSGKNNEIQLKNVKFNDNVYISLKPDFVICINEIRDRDVLESRRLNIPIVLINKRILKKEKTTYDETTSSYTEGFLMEDKRLRNR